MKENTPLRTFIDLMKLSAYKNMEYRKGKQGNS
jgi:hypothetical protein